MAKTPSFKTQQAVVSSASKVEPAVVPAAGAPETSIAVAAYYRAERRGFAPGHELEDWLAAEAEITASSLQQEAAPAELQ